MLDVAGDHILFEDQLRRISEVLHQAGGPEAEYRCPVRPGTVLEKARSSPLHPDTDGNKAERDKGAEGYAQGDHQVIKG
jgi:hypothetical protein